MCYYIQALKSAYAPVAQLDRVTDYESVGRGFESLPAYQKTRHPKASGFLVRRKGLEPLTYWFVASHSIQLSYRRVPRVQRSDIVTYNFEICKYFFKNF